MKAIAFLLLFIALISFVTGQFLFKHAMDNSHRSGFGGDFLRFFIPGIASMTVSFFLTLGLLQHFDLSFVYPFQGLSVILVSAAAAVILKEKVSAQLLFGALLISLGVLLVSLS
jgi:drug/metabolite transporter (DMT)-like permease